MYSLKLKQANKTLTLHGPGTAAPLRGAALRMTYGQEEERSQEIDLALEGPPAAIESMLKTLGEWMRAAGAQAELPGGDFVYLEATATEGGSAWRSKLLDGWLGLLGQATAQRAEGSQGVRLTLRRVNYWEGERTALQLNGVADIDSTAPVRVDNCKDASHANWLFILPSAITGELPAPVELHFRSTDTDANGTLYVGMFGAGGTGTGTFSLEMEAGSAGAGVAGQALPAVGAASGDAIWRASWNGENEVTLYQSPVLETGWYNELPGRAWLPMVRVYTQLPADKIFVKWRLLVKHGALLNTVHDSAGVFVPNGRHLCPCAPVFLPPWPLGAGDALPSLALELRASGGAGAHLLDLDFVTLISLESWRIYKPLVTTAGPGLQVLDDPYTHRVRGLDLAVQYHAVEGPGLQVTPGRRNWVTFQWEKAGGGWSALTSGRVQMFYRPRKRVL